jgi:hypothetical protein
MQPFASRSQLGVSEPVETKTTNPECFVYLVASYIEVLGIVCESGWRLQSFDRFLSLLLRREESNSLEAVEFLSVPRVAQKIYFHGFAGMTCSPISGTD